MKGTEVHIGGGFASGIFRDRLLKQTPKERLRGLWGLLILIPIPIWQAVSAIPRERPKRTGVKRRVKV